MTLMLISRLAPRIEFLRHGRGEREQVGGFTKGASRGNFRKTGLAPNLLNVRITLTIRIPPCPMHQLAIPFQVYIPSSPGLYSALKVISLWPALIVRRFPTSMGLRRAPAPGTPMAIPDGCIDILFDCNESRPGAKICGTSIKAKPVSFQPGHRYFGVRFAPGVVPNFLDVSAKEVVGQELDLLDAAPMTQDIFEQIVDQPEFARQADLFSRFYRGKSPRAASGATACALQAIRERNGNIRIRDLEELTGCTTRTLQRQFHSDIGISPKAFCRIIRCQSAVYDINHRKQLAFSDLACDLGFSDQSHFLREFKQLVSTTPVDYQRRIHSDTYLSRLRCG